MKKLISYFLILFSSFIYAESIDVLKNEIPSENPPSLSTQIYSQPVFYQKRFFYGNCAIMPGLGITERDRKLQKGNSWDIQVGLCPFIFDTVTYFPTISADYNYIHYSREGSSSPYLSYGFGALYCIPYIPLRAGIEFNHGFIDVGAKMLLGFVPSPEVRGGFEFAF